MVSLTNYLPNGIKQNLRHPGYAVKVAVQNLFTAFSRRFLGSHSQHGEDIILSNLLKGIKNGFYVDEATFSLIGDYIIDEANMKVIFK